DEYRIQAKAKLRYLWAEQSRIKYSPTLVQQEVFNNHFVWSNNFVNSIADRTSVGFEASFAKNLLKLEGSYVNLQNYIFFNQQAEPQQLATQQKLYKAQLYHKVALGNLNLEHLGVYTNTDDAPFVRVPEWLINSKIYYQGFLFKKAMFGQIGFETTMSSDYYADAYMPATQQFYLQNSFLVKSYPVIDFFIAADIKTVNVYLKLAHANEGFPDKGYYVTPFYTGLQRSVLFGVKWQFFD
ncbi:MAG: putative porin, partial [Hymenobacteraceae bacterium]|nr:putative porin [Hymenobacteraceae bacterium]MDX5395794.1 putative porin [Hymenobacteraceae bacterium]MDX5442222.1 putative porin [Hymenobacteraceae bacterium]MDX5511849.1 putative porin [Hymenobacteraceae bacterium]